MGYAVRMPSRRTKPLPRTIMGGPLNAITLSRETRARDAVATWQKLAPPLQVKIAAALRHKRRLSKAEAEEAAFHFTDWIAELHNLNMLFASVRWNSDQAQRCLIDFAVHAPAHLAALYRIIMGIPLEDVFGIGAVEGSGCGTRVPGELYASATSKKRAPTKRLRKPASRHSSRKSP